MFSPKFISAITIGLVLCATRGIKSEQEIEAVEEGQENGFIGGPGYYGAGVPFYGGAGYYGYAGAPFYGAGLGYYGGHGLRVGYGPFAAAQTLQKSQNAARAFNAANAGHNAFAKSHKHHNDVHFGENIVFKKSQGAAFTKKASNSHKNALNKKQALKKNFLRAAKKAQGPNYKVGFY